MFVGSLMAVQANFSSKLSVANRAKYNRYLINTLRVDV